MSARWTSEQLKAHQAARMDAKAARQPKPRKYRNEREQVDGVWFDSRKESRHYRALLTLQRAGVITRIEIQPTYPLAVNGEKVATYRADFRITFPDGRSEVQDVKGVRTPVYRLKKRLMKAIYNIEIIEI